MVCQQRGLGRRAPGLLLLLAIDITYGRGARDGRGRLAPGFGPLDCAKSKSSGEDLRERFKPARIFLGHEHPLIMVIIGYRYATGGDKELMRLVGRDGTVEVVL